MDNEFDDIYVENLRPKSGFPYIKIQGSLMYPNPWVGLPVEGGNITLPAADFLVGGVTSFYGSSANQVTFPSTSDIMSQLGMSDISGFAFDYFVCNNSADPMVFLLGSNMVARSAVTGGTNLSVPAFSTGSFRFIGFFDGYNVKFTVSRIS